LVIATLLPFSLLLSFPGLAGRLLNLQIKAFLGANRRKKAILKPLYSSLPASQDQLKGIYFTKIAFLRRDAQEGYTSLVWLVLPGLSGPV
jgi:hypothetical protein